MKKITLLLSLAAILLNIAFFLILSNYEIFNFVLSSLTILASWFFVTFSMNNSPNDGFKIGLAFFFSITFLVKIALALISDQILKDNPILIILVCITFLEFVILFTPTLLKKK